MIKFVKQTQQEKAKQFDEFKQSQILQQTSVTQPGKFFFRKKGVSNDSGTESDGDILDVDQKHCQLDVAMETASNVCADGDGDDAKCTADTNFPLNVSAAMMCKTHLQYDQHSSEEELEVINGPSSMAVAEATSGLITTDLSVRGSSSLISERGSSSVDFDELCGESSTLKRSSSTLIERRKRSMAHSSDDDLRNFLEPILTPVNFRTSPPLEAFKPNRSHMFRSTTPLILHEARYGIENIQLCDNSNNNNRKENDGEEENGSYNSSNSNNNATSSAIPQTTYGSLDSSKSEYNSNSIIKLKMCNSNSSHHIYHQNHAKHQHHQHFHFNSSRSSPASTTALNLVEVRSVSPPSKLFHCAISPRRRSTRNTAHNTHTHTHTQRLQRPHRPCLDFDKMQQVSL